MALFGRLAEGVKAPAARTEFEIISGCLASQYPDTNKGLIADVRPIGSITGVYAGRSMFAALLAAVGFVLLIACADVANMLLARRGARA